MSVEFGTAGWRGYCEKNNAARGRKLEHQSGDKIGTAMLNEVHHQVSGGEDHCLAKGERLGQVLEGVERDLDASLLGDDDAGQWDHVASAVADPGGVDEAGADRFVIHALVRRTSADTGRRSSTSKTIRGDPISQAPE